MTDPTPRPRSAAAPLWVAAGWLALLLGAIGVLMPVLPTTPFVLLAAFLFGKGSPRLRGWLLRHRLFGPIIADWEANGIIPVPVKWLACTMMGLAIGIALWVRLPWPVLAFQAACLTGAAWYVLTRPSKPRG